MTPEQKEKFEKDMAAYGTGKHEDVLVYMGLLEKGGWTLDDVRAWTVLRKEEIEEEQRRHLVKMPQKKCPECGELMALQGVNVSNCTQTGDLRDRSVWLCRNSQCMETVFERRTAREIYRDWQRRRVKWPEQD